MNKYVYHCLKIYLTEKIKNKFNIQLKFLINLLGFEKKFCFIRLDCQNSPNKSQIGYFRVLQLKIYAIYITKTVFMKHNNFTGISS